MYVKTIDYKSPHVEKDFIEALRETGFSILLNHPIPQNLIEDVYQEWREFFKNETKFEYLFDPYSVPQSGYFPFKSENAKGHTIKNLHEYYHYYEENDLPKGLGKSTFILKEKLSDLAHEVLLWIEKGLPEEVACTLSMPLQQMIEGTDMTLVRIIHYPPIRASEDAGAVRAAPHEDIDLLTILPSATSPGLQVLDSAGNWHEVSCDYGTLIFNSGDMLQMATKGYYKSTTHRVTNPVGEAAHTSRYSVPLFFHPRNEVQLSKTHTARSYLEERLRENGVKLSPQTS
jgi:isopenicillin N synthase-like dioxygenase